MKKSISFYTKLLETKMKTQVEVAEHVFCEAAALRLVIENYTSRLKSHLVGPKQNKSISSAGTQEALDHIFI